MNKQKRLFLMLPKLFFMRSIIIIFGWKQTKILAVICHLFCYNCLVSLNLPITLKKLAAVKCLLLCVSIFVVRGLSYYVGEVITIEDYPEGLIAAVVEVLRSLLVDERDFLK